MRLNLGCGRTYFPMDRNSTESGNNVTIYANYIPSVYDATDWINVDRVALPNVHQADLFTYPFEWGDNTVDEIVCSHLVEHIPHEAKVHLGASEALKRAAALDGFYAFMYECWRICKPNATVHIIAPYAFSSGAVTDPTHTRYMMPGTFSYFIPNPDAPFDYQIPCEYAFGEKYFRVISSGLADIIKACVEEAKLAGTGTEGWSAAEYKAQEAMQGSLNGIDEFYVGMTVIK